MVPIQTKLIDRSILEGKERQWINEYHAKVKAALRPILQAEGDERALKYLERETTAI